VPLWQAPETHPYFGTLFPVPDSHTFRRNCVAGDENGQNARKSAAEFEPLLQQVPSEFDWPQAAGVGRMEWIRKVSRGYARERFSCRSTRTVDERLAPSSCNRTSRNSRNLIEREHD